MNRHKQRSHIEAFSRDTCFKKWLKAQEEVGRLQKENNSLKMKIREAEAREAKLESEIYEKNYYILGLNDFEDNFSQPLQGDEFFSY